jgi:arylsulfatase A-like enzyme
MLTFQYSAFMHLHTMRHGDWKLINMKGTLADPKWELYHLGQDPTESNDLSGSKQDVLPELTNQWKAYQEEMIPSIF